MSNIANIAATSWGGTAITWTAAQGAAGDAQNAIWRINNGVSQATNHELRMSARNVSQGKRRTYRVSAQFPHYYTDTTTGLAVVHCISRGYAEFEVDADLPLANAKDYASTFFTALADKSVGGVLEAIAVANAAPR